MLLPSHTVLRLVLNRQEELELRRELLLGVKPIGKVDSSDSAVCVNRNSQCLDVVCAVSPSSEVRQVELNLVPPLVQAHGHGTNEGLHPRRGLIIRSPKSTADVLVVEYLNLETEVLLQVFDDHDQEWKLDSERPV